MQFAIDRVSADVDPELFRRRYYLSRQPVIVSGVASSWPASRSWTAAEVEARVARAPDQVTQQPLWVDVDRQWAGSDVLMPQVLRYLEQHHRPLTRGRSLRVWTSRRGHCTPWHYDGNCVEVFNVQIAGKKRFTIVSPDTPIPCAPFSILGRAAQARPEQVLTPAHRYTQFELEAGDMVYLPRHWSHYVESLDDENINLNWVWTDLYSGGFDAPVTRREQELLAVLFPLFLAHDSLSKLGVRLASPRVQQFHPDYAREYGGERDYAVSRRFFRQIPTRRLLGRVITELRQSRPVAPGASAA